MLRRKLLLMDANVLIDFCDADATVIPLISKHIGPVHVPLPILHDEVEQLGTLDWTELQIPPSSRASRSRCRPQQSLEEASRSTTTSACFSRVPTGGRASPTTRACGESARPTA